MILQERFVIEDCHWYGNMQKIINDFTLDTGVSGRNIYFINPNYQTDIEMTWKYANNVPSNTFVGLGEKSGSAYNAKFMPLRLNNSWSLYYSNNSGNNKIATVSISATTDSVFKITTENLHNCKLYVDDVLKTTQSTKTSMPLSLRIDDFTSTPTTLEYLKIKAL